MTQQQTERERLADILIGIKNLNQVSPWNDDLAQAAALLRGDEPAKPDRYLQVWKEAEEVWRVTVNTDGQDNQAAAVLRRHFEPPSEVIEAARIVARTEYNYSLPRIVADHILKGDQ